MHLAIATLLDAGDHIVASASLYGGTINLLTHTLPRFGITTTFVKPRDLDGLRAAIKPNTKLVIGETIGNPGLEVLDIPKVSEIAHGAGAILAVDSTVATPIFTRPLALGADIVMHSATKYLNGHSDVIAGALATARSDALWTRIDAVRTAHGAILGPFEAWLVLRGLRTVDVRVRAQAETALELASRLIKHGEIDQVLYPGLPQHPGHAIAARQMAGGFGGMLSIRVKGGESAAIATAARVNLWKRATSLGGVESLIEHRASIEGPTSPCPPDLLRLSVGLEDVDDLYADLDRALRAANG